MTHLEDSLMSYVSWPENRVVSQGITDSTSQVRNTASSDKTASRKTASAKPASTSSRTPAREDHQSAPASPKATVKSSQPPTQSPLRRSSVI